MSEVYCPTSLLLEDIMILKKQAEAINKYADKNVRVITAARNAYTVAFIYSYFAPSIPKENFTALARLHQNRTQATLAARFNVPVMYII